MYLKQEFAGHTRISAEFPGVEEWRRRGVYLEPIKIYNFPPSRPPELASLFPAFYARPTPALLLPAGILKSIFIVLLFLGGPFSAAGRRFGFSLADGNIMKQRRRLHCFPQLIGAGCSHSVRAAIQ